MQLRTTVRNNAMTISPPNNELRAEAAATALEAYSLGKGTSLEEPPLSPLELLTDLITDLLHWCDRDDLEFDKALRMAHFHHEEERLEESC
jgi:hypothetical protein